MDKSIEVVRVWDNVLKLRVFFQNSIVTIIIAYAPQVGLPNEHKYHIYDILL